MDRTAAKEEELTFILSSKSAFLEDLGSQPWNSIFSQNQNVRSRARIFDQIVIETLDRHAPLKKIKIRKFHKKGLSQVTLDLIKEREKARVNYSKAKIEDKERVHAIYKIARNKVTARIRRDAKISTINLINESGKPWEYWKNVKKITDPQVVQKMELLEDGVLIQDEQKLSNIFCKFFKRRGKFPE